jgi:hypothetical protein
MGSTGLLARPLPAPVRVPAVASSAIGEALGGGIRGHVIGSSAYAVWVSVGSEVVVVSARDAIRLPNGVAIGAPASDQPFGRVGPGDDVVFEGRRITMPGLVVEIVRHWSPSPSVPAISAPALTGRVRGLPSEVPGVDSGPVMAALLHRSAAELLEAARRMLGRGPGLTPESDDVLAGALASVRILAPACGQAGAAAPLEESEGRLVALAKARTTALSATLIRHAIHGELAEPAAAFVRALAGRGDVRAAHFRLSAVGHSSGPALAAGMVGGALVLAQGGFA